ncbi:MAG: DNA-directed RNA polymerase subunit beta' [Patescibacteria group bacterium]
MEKNYDLKSLSIKLASPEEILSWSFGEVIKPETINYRTQRPEKDGLFSERIFGPTKDYECYCGKYKKVRYKGLVCEKCGVEVTRAVVRRERMGHITLATPVTHIWFLRTVPSRLSLLLDISVPKLEKIIYYAAYVITSVNESAKTKALDIISKELKAVKKEKDSDFAKAVDRATELKNQLEMIRLGHILGENDYYSLAEKFGDVFEADRGAGAIRKILESVNLKTMAGTIEKELREVKDENRNRRLMRRLKLVRSLAKSHVRPEWMIMTVLPILPPDLRPMVPLDGGRYATADLNDLYRRVINRNNRLKKLMELKSPEVILTNEKRMLQEAVDALIDNSSRMGTQLMSTRRRPLRSLADMLKGKQGRFRQNLLGKRVDYSARSVIVVGPELKLDECGIPKQMALELFRHFVINKIIEQGLSYNIKQANRFIEQSSPEVWAILEEVIKDKRVLLNRAPTLHRLGIQAFRPVLIEDFAIRISPLVCAAFNADFDGDQMAVHLPLTIEAQYEAKALMDAGKNLLKPASGDPIVTPTQDVVLGSYFLTRVLKGAKGEGRIFTDVSELFYAYENDVVDINALVKVRYRGEMKETTYGRTIFNSVLPGDYEFVNEQMNKKQLQKLVAHIIEKYGVDISRVYLDKIKSLGFEYATLFGVTWSMADTMAPKEKPEIIKETEKEVAKIEAHYQDGLLTNQERKVRVISIWTDAKKKIADKIQGAFTISNPVFSIIDSGARGSWTQPVQMMGMKGIVANPKNEEIELPIKSSFKEGFSVLEYFISTHGARKGSTDTALKTASAGYLTRRLVDVSQDVIIREVDCGAEHGITIVRKEGDVYGHTFISRIYSRTSLEDIRVDRKLIVRAGEMITRGSARIIQDSSVSTVKVRSPITCKTPYGLCAMCYGIDLTKNEAVEIGEAVGIIAAQSIGEPGTQLTMRTFHVGGVAGVDITQGLPRVEELFEARPPKGKAPLTRRDGIVHDIEDRGLMRVIKVRPNEQKVSKSKSKSKILKISYDEYLVSTAVTLFVKKGDIVKQGQALSEGPLDLREILAYQGVEQVIRYVINSVQRIYVPEGSPINDKHIEIIVRQMLSRVVIKDPGETEFMPGEVVERSRFHEVNRAVKKLKKKPAKAILKLMGITRVALDSSSFLSAASFQETSRVLVAASVEGRVDVLRGLKENVIIGKLIPAGTGSRGIPEEILEIKRARQAAQLLVAQEAENTRKEEQAANAEALTSKKGRKE